jgi:type IV secretion system protein VirB5
VTEKTILQTPYLRARQEWDERFGDQIKSRNNWRLAAFLSMATALVCVTGMVAIGYRSNTVPYVVALDDVGRAVPVIPAKQVAVKDVRLQEAVVARWVTNLRTVIADAVAQRRLVDEVYAETGQNSPASATITEFYSKNSPFDLLTKETVDASVESIVQQSPKTYEVAWTEVTRDLNGNLMSSHRYRAFVSVVTQEVTDARQALVNPLGLYVTNLTWGEVVSTTTDQQPNSTQSGNAQKPSAQQLNGGQNQ